MNTQLESIQQMQRTFSARVRAGLIGGGASAILALAALAAPVMAADQPATTAPEAIGPHTHQLHGLVKSGGSTSFTVTTARYGDVSVTFTAATPNALGNGHGKGNGNGNGHAHVQANLANLTGGDRVVVQGRTSADGKTFVARRVHLLPAADGASNENSNGDTNRNSNGDANHGFNGDTNRNSNGDANRGTNADANGSVTHLLGNVTAASATSLTVKLADGTSQSVTVSADTRIRPLGKTMTDVTVGSRVTVVSKNGAATGIVVWPA
jgi:hypothetical protein